MNQCFFSTLLFWQQSFKSVSWDRFLYILNLKVKEQLWKAAITVAYMVPVSSNTEDNDNNNHHNIINNNNNSHNNNNTFDFTAPFLTPKDNISQINRQIIKAETENTTYKAKQSVNLRGT